MLIHMSWIEPRKHGCRIQEYVQHGLQTVTLENRAIRVTALPDKGADIVELRLKALDLDVLWSSPSGLRDPATTFPSSEGQGTFMDLYEGGWQEIAPSGGPSSSHAGATWGQHGETATLAWDYRIEADEPDHVALALRVRLMRYPVLIHKVLRVRGERAILEVEETLTNEADEPVNLMWGHHPAVGAPFLSEFCRFHLPGGTIRVPSEPAFERQQATPAAIGQWPEVPSRGGALDLSRMPSPEARTAEFLYVTDLPEGWFAMTNDALGAGFGMCWDASIFRHLWYWQVARGAYGYPWYGRTYSMALEPWTSWPGDGLSAAVQQGTALRLAAGQALHTTLYAVLWAGHGNVERVTPSGITLKERLDTEEGKEREH
jgi:Domain of unknown function (DUF4432)